MWKRLRQPGEVAEVLRGLGRSVAAQGVGVALGYGVHVLLARWLGASGFGIYVYVLGWAALLVALAGFGLSTLVRRFVPEYTVQRAWSLLRGLLRWSTGLTLGAGVALALTGLLLFEFLSERVPPAYARAFVVGLWIVPAQALLNLIAGVFMGLYRVGRAHSLAAQRHSVLLVGAALVWWWRGELTSPVALGLTLLATGVVLVLQVGPVQRALPAEARAAAPAYAPRTWSRVAFPLLLVSGFLLLLDQTDLLMVGSFLGPREAGLYRAASKTAGLLVVVYAAATATAGPMVARLFAEQAQDKLQRLVSAAAHGVFWPTLVLVIGLVVLGEWLLRFFGPEYTQARWVLFVLAIGHLVYAATGLGATVLNLTGHQDWGASVLGWAVLLNVGLSAAGVAFLGALGAALATALTMAVHGVVFWALVRRHLKLDISIIYAIRHSLRQGA